MPTVKQIPIQLLEDAERLADPAIGKISIPEWRAMVNEIAEALRARDERAAGIAESMRPTGGRTWTNEQTACFEALTECAVEIRKN